LGFINLLSNIAILTLFQEEDYQYVTRQKRQKESDAYQQKREQQERELAEKQHTFEKEIAERKQTVKAVEDELKDLHNQVGKHPEIMDKALKNKEQEVTSKLQTQYKFEKELFKKESDGELRLRDQTITALQSKIKDLDNLINQLYQKVDNADKNVKDIVPQQLRDRGVTTLKT
jgi:chromosome segregation ATPase